MSNKVAFGGQGQSLASVSNSLCVWSFTSSKDLLLSSTYEGSSGVNKESFQTVCWNHTNQANIVLRIKVKVYYLLIL